MVPTGSLSLRITSSPAAMASIRWASSVSRSRNAALAPADFASATSSALAARIADRAAGWPRPWRQAHGSCALPAQARAHGRPRALARPMSRIVASSFPELPSALSGAFMALIRLAFTVSYHVRRGPARRPRRRWLSTAVHAVSCPGHRNWRNLRKAEQRFAPGLRQGGVMSLPIDRLSSRLPRRFPVGATYVVEGYGGDEWELRVIARYVVLPGGRRINVPSDLSRHRRRRAPGLSGGLAVPNNLPPRAAPRVAAKNLRRGGEPR